jgi:GntR family transcriptional repressor for pyruvate dehydrogenase complex
MARLHRDVLRVLVADIVSGIRPAGEMLPREVDLAAEFDVSRGVARETIRAMEERGLISVKHGKGATVNGPDSWDVFDPDVLSALLDTERGAGVLAQYLECRRLLEVQAAGMAAERASKADVKRIADAFARMEETTRRPPGQASEELFHEADVAFHQAVISATGNRALAGLVERLHSVLVLTRYPLARPRYREERALPEHKRILDAVVSGDAAAAREAMSDHLDTIAGYLGEYRRAARKRPRRQAAAY